MNQPTYEDGTERFTGITDAEITAMAREDFAKLTDATKALPNKFIAWIAPKRVEGKIERAWDYMDNSVEAVMWDDGTGSEIPRGTMIMVRPDEGFTHHVNGVLLGFFSASALMLLQEQ